MEALKRHSLTKYDPAGAMKENAAPLELSSLEKQDESAGSGREE
jgi:hypothetical protein